VSRFRYYEWLKALARQVRADYGLSTPRVLRSDLRGIYKDLGIRIDLWPYPLRQLRGAYFNDDAGATVMIPKGLPDEPAIFSLGHELKHHLVDREGEFHCCTDSNVTEAIEIGAEVFAAELILPEADFTTSLTEMGITPETFEPEALVHLKQRTRTTLSYAGLAKRAEWLGYARRRSLARIKWKKLEEQLYGEPAYKRIQRYRSRRPARLG
jgi:Zn-dependent peptidase ImmA (M78 family)